MITKATIKQIASLRQQKFRKELGLFVVEGRKMTEELLRSDFALDGLFATPAFKDGHADGFAQAETVSETQMAQMSGLDTPPGILAVVRIPAPRPIADDTPWILALDGIANPGNMGTIIRTAEWFGLRDVVCSPDCVELWNPKVIQATMGSAFRMNVVYTPLPDFLSTQKQAGKAAFGALLDGENLFRMNEKPSGGVIVIGSESHGIKPEVLPHITRPVTIPRKSGSQTESLNAAVAGAIIMAEFTVTARN